MSGAMKIIETDRAGGLLAAADTMGQLARENAYRTEADRRVPQDLIAQFRDAGLYRMLQPKAFGG